MITKERIDYAGISIKYTLEKIYTYTIFHTCM